MKKILSLTATLLLAAASAASAGSTRIPAPMTAPIIIAVP